MCKLFRVASGLRMGPVVRESDFHETFLLLICHLVVETLSNEDCK